MEDDSLDKMDPYQRGANDIIWESMMHGSYKKKEKNDEHRDYYADAMEPSTSEGNHLGSQEEASTNIEKFSTSNRYIVGPMVVRVLPDGSPVPRDDPLPKDEDAEEFLAMRSKPVPSLEDIATSRHHEVVATRRDSHTSIKRSKH